MPATINRDAIFSFFDSLIDRTTSCVEFRIFNANFDRNMIKEAITYKKVYGGYYDNHHALGVDAVRLDGVSGYVTVNPVPREFLARAANKLIKINKDEGTQDKDIKTIRHLYIDIDSKRPAGMSATGEELSKAFGLRDAVFEKHPEIMESSIWGCSGNGVWILTRVDDWPNDKEHNENVARFNRSLRAHFKDFDGASIDPKTINPSRVMCLPGTLKCKGSHIPERPWRMVTRDIEREAPLFDFSSWIDANEVKEVPKSVKVAMPRTAAQSKRAKADLAVRISAHLATKEPAIAGQGGHDKAFDVAMDLVQGWDLGVGGARPYFEQWNLGCVPPWSPAEIDHKLDEADSASDSQGRARGWIRDADRNGHHANGNGYGHNFKFPPPLPLGGDAAQQGEGIEPRDTIVVRQVIHEVVNEAMISLKRERHFYRRVGQLVTVVRDGEMPRGVHFEGTMPRIVPLEHERIRELVGMHADWVTLKATKDSEDMIEVPALPPEWVAKTILARHSWPGVRPLKMITESPIFRPDGTILYQRGYDEETAILYEPNADFGIFDEEPTREDALAAADRILDLVAEFPFVSPVHKAAWFAGLLTPFARFAIDGPCPLFLIDAGNPASGKSKLIDLVSVFLHGAGMPRMVFTSDDAELEKRVTSIALMGLRIVLIDNVDKDSVFGGAALDAAITATTWCGRILGHSKMTSDIPLYGVWYATGNNIQLRGDGFRRFCWSRIEVKEGNPEQRDNFKYPELVKHTKEHRIGYVRDLLTILRAFHLAGRPPIPAPPMDFTEWSRLIRSAVYWVTGADCWANHDRLKERDSDILTNQSLLEGWWQLPGQEKGMTAAKMLEWVRLQPGTYQKLHEALMEWSRSSDLPTPRQVGMRLNHIRDRVVNGKCMRSRLHEGTHYWNVEAVSHSEPAPEIPGTRDWEGVIPSAKDPDDWTNL